MIDFLPEHVWTKYNKWTWVYIWTYFNFNRDTYVNYKLYYSDLYVKYMNKYKNVNIYYFVM